MDTPIILILGILIFPLGFLLGYYGRLLIARKKLDSIEILLRKRVEETKKKQEEILSQAREKAKEIIERAEEKEEEKRRDLLKTERLLLKKENNLELRYQTLERKENEFRRRVEELKKAKEKIERLKEEVLERLEKTSGLSREEAREELFKKIEKEYQKEILERVQKLEKAGWEQFEQKAREILSLAIQKCTISQAQEITTTPVTLPSEEIKGRIIGKEGRNIRTFERLTGVELIIDETPDVVLLSSFDPIKREIARIALEKLILNGRIQPVRIEEYVKRAEAEINSQIKKAGEQAMVEAGVFDLPPKLVHLLGRLKFRTSYGQNVLRHSIEVSLLASTLAYEIGANAQVCKKAGLLHDIGKGVDKEVEGSHVDIGIKILERFQVEPEVITAMKSHHGDFPFESLEAVLVQVADQISGARPGARRDTLENYLKRLSDLENIALSFSGVEKAWALQAGRELRVFVKPEEIDDLGAKRLAREIANQIERELRYPGEIKVDVIRETRVIEYAR